MNTKKFVGQRAIIYTRISRDRTGEGLGVERQEDMCRRYADTNGMEVIEVVSDNDISGYSGRHRPGFERLKTLVERREVDAVICYKQDRLTRNQAEFFSFLELIQKQGKSDPGVGFHAPGDVGEGYLDLTTAGGALNVGIMSALAQYESAVKRDRMKLRQRQKAEAGEWLGGARPFGWNKSGKFLEVNEAEAAALRQAGEDLLAGKSLHSIVNDWADPSRPGGPIKSTLGKRVTVQSLKQMLTRTRNIGYVVTNFDDGLAPVVGNSPAIMSEEMFEAIQRLLSDPKRRKSKSNKAKHLLSGIAQCHCGEIVRTYHATGRADKNGKRKKHINYACMTGRGGHVSRRKEYVDTVVELFVFRALIEDLIAHGDSPKVVAEVNDLTRKLRELHERRDSAGELIALGKMAPKQLAAFNKSMDEQIAEVEGQLEALRIYPSQEDQSGLDKVLREHKANDEIFKAWRRSPLDDRREWLRQRFHIVLRPRTKGSARLFDPDTVSVYPRLPSEYGTTLDAEEVKRRPITPITQGGPPPSMNNLYGSDDDVQITESWPDYLNYFANMSGLGWMVGFNIDPETADSRANWTGHWRDPSAD